MPEDLGTVFIKVDMTETGPVFTTLDKLVTVADKLDATIDKAAKTFEGLNTVLGTLGGSIANETDAINKLTGQLQAATTAQLAHTEAAKAATAPVAQIADAVKQGGESLAKGTAELGKHSEAMGEAGKAAGKLASSILSGGEGGEGLKAGLELSTHLIKLLSLEIGGFIVVAALAAKATYDYQQALKTLDAVSVGVGRTAGISGAQMEAAAERGAAASRTQVGAAREFATELAQTGKIGGEVFEGLISVQADWAVRNGISTKQARESLKDIFSDPSKGAHELNEKMGLLDSTTVQYIDSLQRQHKEHEAQDVLLKAIQADTKGAADQLGGFSHAWDAVTSAISGAVAKTEELITRTQIYTALGPGVYAAAKAAAEAEAKARKDVAEANKTSQDGRNLFTQYNPDAGNLQKFKDDLATARNAQSVAISKLDAHGILEQTQVIGQLTHAVETYIPAGQRMALIEEARAKQSRATTDAEKGVYAAEVKRLELAGATITQQDAANQITAAGQIISDKFHKTHVEGLTAEQKEYNKVFDKVTEYTTRMHLAGIAVGKTRDEVEQLDGEEIARSARAVGIPEKLIQGMLNEAKQTAALTKAEAERKAGLKEIVDLVEKLSTTENRQLADGYKIIQQDITRAEQYGASREEIVTLAAEQDLYNKGIYEGSLAWEKYRDKHVEARLEAAQPAFAIEDAEKFLDIMGRINDQASKAANALSDNFGTLGRALGGALTAHTNYYATIGQIEKQQAEDKVKYANDDLRLGQAQILTEGAKKNAVLEYTQSSLGSVKQLFDQKSTAYKILDGAEKAAAALEAINTVRSIALSTAKGASYAATGAAAMFAALGPFAFPVVGAMVAVLAGLGLKLAGGGGSASVAPTSPEELTKRAGAGTIFGDTSAKSDSIGKSIEETSRDVNKNLEYSSDMTKSLRAIKSNTEVMATVMARQIAGGQLFNTDGLGLGSSSSVPLKGLLGYVPVIGGIVTAINSAIFHTNTVKSLYDQGLSFAPQSVGSILDNGVNGSSYQTVETKKTSKLFGITVGGSDKFNTTDTALSDELQRSITLVIGSIKDSVLTAAGIFGVTGADAMVDAFNVDLGKLSFKDKTGDEIESELNAVFSSLGDKIAVGILPILTQYQQLGEGGLETLTRLARDYQIVDTTLYSLGIAFNSVGVASIPLRESLIKLAGDSDTFVSQAQFFAENFLTEAERMKPIQETVQKSLDALHLGNVTTIEDYKNIVEGLDLTTDSGQSMYQALMNLAPAFKSVIDYTNSLGSSLSTIAEYRPDGYNAGLNFSQNTRTTLTSGQADPNNVEQNGGAIMVGGSLVDPHTSQLVTPARLSPGGGEAAYKAMEAAAKAAADAFAKLKEDTLAAVPGLLQAGDVMELLKQQTALIMSDPAHQHASYYNRDGSFNPGSLNADQAKAQAQAAKVVLGQIQAVMLTFPHAADAMRQLIGVIHLPDSHEFGGRDALSYQSGTPGFYGASADAAFVSQSGYGYDPSRAGGQGHQTEYFGADVVQYHSELDALRSSFEKGEATLEDYNKGVDKLNTEVGQSFVSFANDVTAQLARIYDYAAQVNTAAVGQIKGVFGQIGQYINQLDAAAAAAGTPLAAVSKALSVFGNIGELINDALPSARAGGLSTADSDKAAIISEAAKLASRIVTTQDANAAAAALRGTASFSGADNSIVKTASLLLDGLKAFDPDSLLNAMLRVDNALINGSISQAQYTDIVNTSFDIFNGLNGQIVRVSDSFKKLADELLLDSGITAISSKDQLKVAAGLFQSDYTGAIAGDTGAQNALSSDTKTFLQLAKDNSHTAQEYADIFDQVQVLLRSPAYTAATDPRLGSANVSTSDADKQQKAILAALTQLQKTMKDITDFNDYVRRSGMPQGETITS